MLELGDLRQVDGIDKDEAGEGASSSGYQDEKGEGDAAGDLAMAGGGLKLVVVAARLAGPRLGIVVPVRWSDEVQNIRIQPVAGDR